MSSEPYKADLNLEKALEHFERVERELSSVLGDLSISRVDIIAKIHGVVIANRDWAYALERIHAYSGGIPREYALRYFNDVGRCTMDLNSIHNKNGLEVSNWLSLMRLSRTLVRNIRTY